MTVNKKTRDMIIDNTPKTCFFHDWWTYLVCVRLGNVAYNNEVTVNVNCVVEEKIGINKDLVLCLNLVNHLFLYPILQFLFLDI